MTSGILLVDKPQGISSHRAVAIARRRLGTRKVGHAGTLDPMATGLLLLGIGPSTRLLTHLVGLDKTYTATIRLGVATDSDDADGTVTTSTGADPDGITDDRIEAVVDTLRGPISQVPSTVSAIKVDGKRAYAMARAGETVELRARDVTIREFVVLGRHDRSVRIEDPAGTGAEANVDVGADVPVIDLDVTVTCTSGTYVRALARDIGTALGTGGHLTALRRTAVGPFAVTDAVDLDDDAVDPAAHLLHPADVAGRLFPTTTLEPDDAGDLADGKRVATDLADTEGPVAAVAISDGRLIGLVAVRRGTLRVLTNFPTGDR